MHSARIQYTTHGVSVETYNEADQTISLMQIARPTKDDEFIDVNVYVNEGNANRVLGPLQIDIQCNEDLIKIRENPSPCEGCRPDVLERELPGISPETD